MRTKLHTFASNKTNHDLQNLEPEADLQEEAAHQGEDLDHAQDQSRQRKVAEAQAVARAVARAEVEVDHHKKAKAEVVV